MQITARDSSVERRIVTAMVVDTTVLARIAGKWKPDYMRGRWSAIVADWCIHYYEKYGKAPKKSIQGIFESWAENHTDQETVQLVRRFLESLSDEYEAEWEINSDHVLDMAGDHFSKVLLRRHAEAIMGDLEHGDLAAAKKRHATFDLVDMGPGAGIDIFQDKEAVAAVFAEQREPLVVYPGALGNFFGDALERDGFIAFMGPEKRGKTWWLIDVAYRAMQQGRRVAFFEVGDMSQNQLLRRFLVRVSRHPIKPCSVKVPLAITPSDNDTDPCSVDFEERIFTAGLDLETAWSSCQLLSTKHNGHPLLRVSCHPNSTLNANGMRGILRVWERSGWEPDVVVIDYADIMAPLTGTGETRDQINATWKSLRGLSQELHCLVVTATQADAGSYKAHTIDRSNFSEDKRKFAHVTGMIGINSTPEEKARNLQRLNWLALREDGYDESRCVHVAGCLELGNPAIKSTF